MFVETPGQPPQSFPLKSGTDVIINPSFLTKYGNWAKETF
jgi:hypothetical protein